MLANATHTYLLASPDPTLLAALQSALAAAGERVQAALSTESALAALSAETVPDLAVLDVNLPGMETSRLLAATRAIDTCKHMAIVLIADIIAPEHLDRLHEGVIDDVILRSDPASCCRFRFSSALRSRSMARELESLREESALSAQMDRLTGIYNRESLLALLFRETDRVQRMNTSLCLVLFDLDDFGHWNERLGSEACDDLLRQAAARTTHLLRSYDLLGRAGSDEFLVVLPGCSPASAVMLAERIRTEVFATPFRVAGCSIRLSAGFGIAASHGRSPVVVLREAEHALRIAKGAGPESIQCFNASEFPEPAPVTFLSPSSGDEIVAW